MNYEEEKQARAETSGHRTSGGEPDPLGVLERLKEALGARTDAECARLLGVKPQNVSQARSSGQVPPGWVYAAAYGHGASADWIWFGEGPRTRVGDGPDPGEFGYVPMARAELSAGDGALVTSEAYRDRYAFRRSWLHRVATSASNLVLMTVRGDSMESTMSDGDTVLVDMGRKDVRGGGIYAFASGDAVMIKRLDLRGTSLWVTADNRDIYEPYGLDLDGVRIIGKVIWIARQLERGE